MVLRLHQHNIGYTADGFYRSDDPTNSDSYCSRDKMASLKINWHRIALKFC